MNNEAYVIRSLSPWAKILCSMIICVVCAALKTPEACLILAIGVGICTVLAKASMSDLLKTAKPLLIFMPVYAILCLTSSGLATVVTLLLKYTVFIITASLFLSITPYSEITSGLVTLMKPLKKIKVPVSDIALVISVALRFIPTITDEYERIRTAQLSRGTDPAAMPLKQRIRTVFSAVTPLLLSIFRRAENLSYAMDSRGYAGNHISRKKAEFTAADGGAMTITALFCTFLILLEFLH